MFNSNSKLLRLLRWPKVLLAGIFTGLAICAFLGRYYADTSYYEHFVRIGGAHQTDVTFSVTASQLKTFIRTKCRKDQILILVGGSSVMMGAGQPIRYLWSNKLQDILGNEYCVVNLATPAGGLAGFASVMLEVLSGEFRREILVSDSNVPPSDAPDGMMWNRHLFWDAHYKGLLAKSKVDTKERLKVIEKRLQKEPSKNRLRIEQIKLGMWLDSYLYFNDLWSHIHYRWFMTIYNPTVGPFNWKARRNVGDYDYDVNSNETRKLLHYPSTDSAMFNGELSVVRSFYPIYFKSGQIDESLMAAADIEVQDYPLTKFSRNIVIAQVSESPYYLNYLTKEERHSHHILKLRNQKILEDHGYHVVPLDDVGPEDYGDRPHLNTLGGNKLAAKVAQRILTGMGN